MYLQHFMVEYSERNTLIVTAFVYFSNNLAQSAWLIRYLAIY
jgi:hypothetical protein